jgi:glutathione synthase/RimK-type ligase-like ATP-grasp enzyme
LSLPSDALTRHVEATAASGARLRVVRDPSEIPPEATVPLVLNWGSIQPLPRDIVALNRPEVVRVASDQVESLQRLRELAPRTVVNPGDLGLLRSDHVVAKRRHGSRGSGKAVIQADGPIGAGAGYDCYQEFIPDRREYRVSVLSDRIVSAYVKRPPAGTVPDDLRPAWSFERAAVIPRAVAAVAKEGARRVGLDYAGVDVVEDLRTGRVYCLEANAAPGMSEDTIKSVYAHIQQTLRGRLARAS